MIGKTSHHIEDVARSKGAVTNVQRDYLNGSGVDLSVTQGVTAAEKKIRRGDPLS